MKIRLTGKDRRLRIMIPTSVIFNRLTAVILSKALQKNDNTSLHSLTADQFNQLFRVLRRCKRKYPDLRLVEAYSSSGEMVEITL